MSYNPFDDEYAEPTASKSNSNPYMNGTKCDSFNPSGNYSIQSQVHATQSRTFASQQRALASIAASEQIGVDTARELLDQGEKLSHAEERLDEISEMQKDSQRQLNVLSSMFGGFRNWFSRKPTVTTTAQTNVDQTTKVSVSTARNTPSSLTYSASAPNWSDQWASNQQSTQAVQPSTTDSNEFDKNLTLMSSGMQRLMGLARGMNEELTKQNEQLDRMNPQVENISDTMTRQNRQMDKILGVKSK